ncbi:MAG: DUF4328 domain-containing protein [Planctomycetota bacterium]
MASELPPENPYAATSYGSQQNTLRQEYQFKPIDRLAKPIIVLMVCVLMASIIVMIADTIGHLMFPTYSDPDAAVSEEEMGLLLLIMGVAAIQVLSTLVLGILVCIFMYRANANARSFGAIGMEHSPGWCAGAWFVPILNLFRPFQCMSEIYRASKAPATFKQIDAPQKIGMWWACWIISTILDRLSGRLALMGDFGYNLLIMDWISLFLTLGAGLLLLSIVNDIVRFQAALLNGGNANDNPQLFGTQTAPPPTAPSNDRFEI